MTLKEILASALLLCIIVVTVSGRLICLSCKGISQSTDCGYVEECSSHSICYMDMYVSTAGAIYFDLGCRDRLKCNSHRRRNSKDNETEVLSPSYLSRKTYFPINITISEHFAKQGTNFSEVITRLEDNLMQRRDNHLIAEFCCENENLCNVKGCGQTGFMQSRGPICFACDQQINPNSCREIKVCGRDEMCYIEEITLAQQTIYHTSCRSRITCHDSNIVMIKAPGILVGREVNIKSHVTDYVIQETHGNKYRKRSPGDAKGCCETDMCNTVLPQNGNWEPWTTWGVCSTSCGYNGSRKRYRKCTFPPPEYGGLPCVGEPVEVDVTCANSDCNRAMVCLSCQSSISPRTCNYIETCGPNSVCYLEQYITHVGEVRYQSGCRDKLQCQNGVRKSKRFMLNGDYLSCAECCDGNLCNSKGCGEPRNTNRGPICYSCSQQRDRSHCNQIDVCNDGQKCGLVRHKFVDTFYQTMCLDKEKCISYDSNSDDYPKCCTTSLCSFPNQNSSTKVTITTADQGFTTAPTKQSTSHNGFIITPTKQLTANSGSTTAPTKQSTAQSGFTTAPTKQSTAQSGFTTAPTKQSTSHSGFTTAPTKQSTAQSGFTTAPTKQSTAQTGFTTAPTKQSTSHSGFTTAPTKQLTAHSGFTTAPTKQSTTQKLGEWSDWSAWGPCSETHSVTGYKERLRHCSNPSHTPPNSCTDEDVEYDRTYCSGGGTDACIPAEITDIQVVKGEWSLGRYVVLKCIFTGTPLPQVFWQTHTKLNVQDFKGDKAQVLIGPILEEHRGKYVCEASNLCGKAATMEYTAPDFT